ncbi:MAG: ATP-binding protein [Coprobacillus sp.]|nr:ATP-binding protein [Coprobacillus sp.]MCI9094459.1 ATP-binding protein [Coprobacillus sp.]
MKKVGDFMITPEISNMKKESLLSLSQEKHIQNFFKDNHIDTSLMLDYWVELLDYNDDYKMCMNCSSLEHCPKDNPGMRKKLAYYDNEIIIELESCSFGKLWEKKRLLLEKFVITNVNDELLLTDMKNLDIIKNIKNHYSSASPNTSRTIEHILSYIDTPTERGLFLHGEMRCGKTTLLAGLMNALAKQGKEIGFIHFPTYLIDLKASFSTGDNEYAMERLMKVDYLLLDGIGEENVTPWSRDEILLTILSYRLLNHLPTFFTSMYGYKELNKVYTIRKGDEIRANTITSKMKALSNEIMLDGGRIR